MNFLLRSAMIVAGGLFALSIVPAQASASVPSAGLLGASLAAQGEYGTIKGRLVWGGPSAPATKTLVEKGKASKDPEVCAAEAPLVNKELVVDPDTKGISYAFAYLLKPKGTNPSAVKELLAAHPKAEIDQKQCEFVPYVLAIHQDQKLVLKSSDPVNHNVRYAAFSNTPLNQLLAPNSEMEVKLVAERRPLVLACDIHPWMKGYLMVFDHPFFAITGSDGSFEIKGVPAGEQSLVLWQEKVGYANPEKAKGKSVKVVAGQTTDIGEIKIDPASVK